jgi:hypothetical protein
MQIIKTWLAAGGISRYGNLRVGKEGGRGGAERGPGIAVGGWAVGGWEGRWEGIGRGLGGEGSG